MVRGGAGGEIVRALPGGYEGAVCLDRPFAFITISRSTDLLTGKRIVTSHEVLTQAYFRELDERVGLNSDEGTRIEYVSGSVEAACALGLADGIGTISSSILSLSHMLDGLMGIGAYSGSRRVGRDDASLGSSPIIDVITKLGSAHPIDYA